MVNTFNIDYITKNKEVVFFDFDDTLCCHLRLTLNDETSKQWHKAMFDGDVNFYLDKARHLAPKSMLTLVNRLYVSNIKCNCLTWGSDNRVYEPKKNFLRKYYGNCFSNIYITGSREGKLQLVLEYCKNYNIPLHKVLMVDDHPETLNEFRKVGIECISPVSVMAYFEYL